MRAERSKFSIMFIFLVVVFSTVPTYAQTNPPVYLLSGTDGPEAAREAVTKSAQELGFKFVDKAPLGDKFKITEARFAEFVRKIADASDGADPIFVAITDTRGVSASFLRTKQGARVLSVSLGALAAVDDDSQLALLVGHELKHGSSQIEEMLETKKKHGYVKHRPTIWDGLSDRGHEKTIENEVDVKALVDKVHKKGFSPARAIKLFEKIESQYGDAYGFSHPMIVQRMSVLNAAMTGMTRGKGEELRAAPVNELINPEWKAFFKSSEYRKAASKTVQSALRSRPFTAAEKVFTEMKDGTIDYERTNPDRLMFTEVNRRWEEMASSVVDRPLKDNVKLGEALRHQVARDYLVAKERVLGKTYQAKSIHEAAFLLLASEADTWNPALPFGSGGSGDLEDTLKYASRDRAYDAKEILELRETGNSQAVLEAIAEKQASLDANDAKLKTLARLYKIPLKEVERRLDSIVDYDQDYNYPRYMEAEEKVALRAQSKMNVKLGPALEAEQMRAIEGFKAHLGDFADINRNWGREFAKLRELTPKAFAAYREMILFELPKALLKKAEGATPEVKSAIANKLQYSWLNELGGMGTTNEVTKAFSSDEGSKTLRAVVELINETNLARGGVPYDFAPHPRLDAIVVQDSKVYVPPQKLALYMEAGLDPFEKVKRNLILTIKNSLDMKSMSQAVGSYVENQREAVTAQRGSEWLNGIRDAMAERYKTLNPAIKNPGELAEAVIDLNMSWGHWPTYKIGSAEMVRRLKDAAAVALPPDPKSSWSKPNVLASYDELFRYRVWQMRSGSAGDLELFKLMSSTGPLLSDHASIVEDASKYQQHVELRKDYAHWAAENAKPALKDAIRVSGGVYMHGGGQDRIKPTDADQLRLTGEVVRKFRKDGVVNWRELFKTGLDDPYYLHGEFWTGLSGGSDSLAVKEFIRLQQAFRESAADPKYQAEKDPARYRKSRVQLSGKLLDDDFVKGPLKAANAEELQQILKNAFVARDPSPARDQVFERFWKATEQRPDLRTAFVDEKLVSKLMFKENGLALAKYQIATRYPNTAKSLRDPGSVTTEIQKIRKSIEIQFPEPSFTRNQVLDFTEKRMTTTPTEHRALASLWVNQDNWAEMKGLALSDSLDAVAKALETNAEKLDFIEYVSGRSKSLPADFGSGSGFRKMDSRVKEQVMRVLPLLPARFESLDRFERAFAIHPFLAGEKGVLGSPESLQRVQKMILGNNSEDVRFKAFFESYMESVPAHEKSSLTSYLIGQTGRSNENAGKVMRDILEAMPPLGIRAGQEIRSSGRASDAINKELDQLRDHALPPSRKQIHGDVAKAFDGNEKNVRVGKLRGSGSVNYVVDIDVYDTKTKKWHPRVLKVQRENVGGHVTAEDGNWQKALAKLRQHSDREVRMAASVIEDARAQAVSRLRPGGVELNARAEAALHPRAAASYDTATTRAVQPDTAAAALIPDKHRERYGVYERIEGVPLNEVKDAAEKKRFATAMLNQELEAIFKTGTFDTDPQLGNWLRESKTGKFVRLDYAQLTTVDRSELEEFRKLVVAIIDPKTGAKDAGTLAKLWSSLMKPAADAKLVEAELGKIIAGSNYKSAKGPWERLTLLRHDMNEQMVAKGLPAQEFREGGRAAWTSFKKLSGLRGEYLTDEEFFKVFNGHVKLPITVQFRLARAAGMTAKEIAESALSSIGLSLNACAEKFAGIRPKAAAQ